VSLASLQCQAEARHCQAEVRLTDQAAIRAIVGEAANQSDRVMLAVPVRYGTVARLPASMAERASHPLLDQRRMGAGRAGVAQSAQPISQTEVRLAAGCRYFGCPTDAPYFLRTLHFHRSSPLDRSPFTSHDPRRN